MITDAEFANMVKRYFMAILASRLGHLSRNPVKRLVKISTSGLAQEDKQRANGFIDDSWLDYLQLAGVQVTMNALVAGM